MDSLADEPMSFTERRATAEHNGKLWSARDALIAVLREIDAGKIKVKNVAICLSVESDDGEIATEHVVSYKSRLELLGTIVKTMNWVSGNEP